MSISGTWYGGTRRIRSTEQVPRTPPEGGRYGEALAAARTKYRVRGMIHETRHGTGTEHGQSK